MNRIDDFVEALKWAHELLDMTTADLTTEQAHWRPPGTANPIAALYVHAVCAEDAVVNVLLRSKGTMFENEWAGKTGASAPAWAITPEWAGSIRVDLEAFRVYAMNVAAETSAYLQGLPEAELDRVLNLTRLGMGHRKVSWILSALLIGHLHNMAGEISCLKGLQGAKGYPF